MTTITIDRNVSIPLRDGTLTSADIYRPAGAQRLPTLLQRTPYNKNASGGYYQVFAIRAATAGYAVVIQDVRGRYNSGGDFHPFVQEQPDGFDTCEWIVAQPWSNGRIGMFGGSYVGLTQWQAALAGAPGLEAVAPHVTASDYHDGWTYQGGAFNLYFNYSWATGLTSETAGRRRAADPATLLFAANLERVDDLNRFIVETPLDCDQTLLELGPWYAEWIGHPALDDYWDHLNVAGRYQDLDIASFNSGGWYDVFLGGTIGNYLGMKWEGGSERSRNGSRLLIGPWSHATASSGGAAGDYFPGAMGSPDAVDLQGQWLGFFDRWLRDHAAAEYDATPPVSIFVMGENRWRSETSWPLERAVTTEFFLGSGGRANTAAGDGKLLRERATGADTMPDHYLSDPRDPVPTVGGQLCCPVHWSPSGALDQKVVEGRADVLVYTTAPFEEPTEVTGPVTVILYAATSAIDTDFTAKLVDVCPCGCVRNLTDGIIRARYRTSPREAGFLTPHEVNRYEIDLWATSLLLQPGHALRLEIASSNFPRFDRNYQNGGVQATTPLAEAVVAHQTVLHDAEHPSRLVVQIVPRG
ncbi:MAG: CocE/NonD family hydrolase [Thermomicrobiales bacterium]|nr:CocE/NonD family hydrolase [Thermomicrobiales bacterium]